MECYFQRPAPRWLPAKAEYVRRGLISRGSNVHKLLADSHGRIHILGIYSIMSAVYLTNVDSYSEPRLKTGSIARPEKHQNNQNHWQ